MLRTLHAEFLDTLPADHADAIASRRDLVLINRLMGNQRWMQCALNVHATGDQRVLELGAGAGDFGRWWHEQQRRRQPAAPRQVCGLDLAPRPACWPDSWAWEQKDLLSYAGYGEFDVVIANLTLHHLDAGALAKLGEKLRAGPRVLLASEPARRRLHLWQAGLLRLLGINHVTRHDALVSVRAGFRGLELPQALGLSEPDWSITANETWLGAYRMTAVRVVP